MAKRYRQTKGILLHRIGSFFRRLFGLKSKEQYLDEKKMQEASLSEKDEPERLAIVPETTEAKTETIKEVDTVVENQKEEEIVEAPAVVVEPASVEAETSYSDSFVNEDTFYSEY